MLSWKGIIDQLNNQYNKSDDLILELVNYQYGYIGWCLENRHKEEAIDYLRLAEENVKLLEAEKINHSLLCGYKAAFFGYHIALNKFLAPFYGPRSTNCAKQAVEVAPDQFFGYIQLGNVKFHTPALMGGSKTEAIGYYLTAKAMMEKRKEGNIGDWNYLSLLMTLARAYESTNNSAKAKLMYDEILNYEPEFKLVKEVLYPQLLKKGPQNNENGK